MKEYNFKNVTNLFFSGEHEYNINALMSILQRGMSNAVENEVHPKEIERQERLNQGRRFRRARSITEMDKSTSSFSGTYNDSVIVLCGGCGFGTKNDEYFEKIISKLNTMLVDNKSYLVFVRGANDNPSYFTEEKFSFSNVVFAEDYSILRMKGFNCLCIGGGIPFDREWKKEQEERIGRTLLFEDSKTTFDEELIDKFLSKDKIECVISSDAPSFVQPHEDDILNSIWTTDDDGLAKDLLNQRVVFDKIYIKFVQYNKKPYVWCFSNKLGDGSKEQLNKILFMTCRSIDDIVDVNEKCCKFFGTLLNGDKSPKPHKKITTKIEIGKIEPLPFSPQELTGIFSMPLDEPVARLQDELTYNTINADITATE